MILGIFHKHKISKYNVLVLQAWALEPHRTTYIRGLYAFLQAESEEVLKNNIAKKGFLQTQS